MSQADDLPHISNLGVGRRREITDLTVFATATDVSILFLDREGAGVAFWSVRAGDPRTRWALLDDAQTLYRFVIGSGTRELDDDGRERETYPVRWLPRHS